MILFVRHGQTDNNVKHILTGGDWNIPINAQGKAQAEETACKLKNTKIDLVVCSPLIRAKQTAEIILKYHKNIPILFDDRLKERLLGDLNGEIDSDFPDCWKMGKAQEELCKLKHVETIDEFYNRCKDFIEDIRKKYKNKTVLLVAHNGVGRILKCVFNDFPKSGNLDDYDVDNAEVVIFDL